MDNYEVNEMERFESTKDFRDSLKKYDLKKYVMFNHDGGIGNTCIIRYEFTSKKSFLGIPLKAPYSTHVNVTNYEVW